MSPFHCENHVVINNNSYTRHLDLPCLEQDLHECLHGCMHTTSVLSSQGGQKRVPEPLALLPSSGSSGLPPISPGPPLALLVYSVSQLD